MTTIHWRAPRGNPKAGLPWCMTSDTPKDVEDEIVTSTESRVTCKECFGFLERCYGGGEIARKHFLASEHAAVERNERAAKVRANLDETMDYDGDITPGVDWFGDDG